MSVRHCLSSSRVIGLCRRYSRSAALRNVASLVVMAEASTPTQQAGIVIQYCSTLTPDHLMLDYSKAHMGTGNIAMGEHTCAHYRCCGWRALDSIRGAGELSIGNVLQAIVRSVPEETTLTINITLAGQQRSMCRSSSTQYIHQ